MRIPLLLDSTRLFAQKKENIDDVFVALCDVQQLETFRDLFFVIYLYDVMFNFSTKRERLEANLIS